MSKSTKPKARPSKPSKATTKNLAKKRTQKRAPTPEPDSNEDINDGTSEAESTSESPPRKKRRTRIPESEPEDVQYDDSDVEVLSVEQTVDSSAGEDEVAIFIPAYIVFGANYSTFRGRPKIDPFTTIYPFQWPYQSKRTQRKIFLPCFLTHSQSISRQYLDQKS